VRHFSICYQLVKGFWHIACPKSSNE